MWFNPIMSAILRSPLHPMLGDTMLLTVTGRKSGHRYTTPVGYYQVGDLLWVMSSRDRTWWRNVRGGARVSIHIHGRDVQGFAEAVLNEEAVAVQVAEYLRHVPMAARGMRTRLDHGAVNPQDAARLARQKLFVKIQLSGTN